LFHTWSTDGDESPVKRVAFSLGLLCAMACVTACTGSEAKPEPPGPGKPVAEPLRDSGFRPEWGIPAVPTRVGAGQRFPAAVLVTNGGDQTWLPARYSDGRVLAAGAVRLGYRWWKGSDHNTPYTEYAGRGELNAPVGPWQTALVAVEVVAPDRPADYELQLDLVQELVAWFATRGAATLFVPVRVTPAS